MDALRTAFPDLITEIIEALRRLGRMDLTEQLHDAFVSTVTFDNRADAGYIYLRAGRTLNTVEERVVGVRHGETICLETKHSINLDTDNFGRLTGIELLSPPGTWKGELRRRAAV